MTLNLRALLGAGARSAPYEYLLLALRLCVFAGDIPILLVRFANRRSFCRRHRSFAVQIVDEAAAVDTFDKTQIE
jgi:hypothetical protein